MKNSKYLIFVITVLFFSCKKPIVHFTEPQPNGKKNLSNFPKSVLGNYANPELNYILSIKNDLIIRNWIDKDTVSSKEIFELKKENILISSQISDTLFFVEFYISDTLFDLKKGDALRKLKNDYFLNIKNSENNWNVSKLTFRSNYLSLSELKNESEIELLNQITNQKKTDSVYTKTYSLNKRQFKEFVKKNGFSESEIFIKQ